MVRASVLGERIEPTGPPTIEPQCPTCAVALEKTPKQVMLPAAGVSLALLRCPKCKESTYWREYPAYAPVSQEIEW